MRHIESCKGQGDRVGEGKRRDDFCRRHQGAPREQKREQKGQVIVSGEDMLDTQENELPRRVGFTPHPGIRVRSTSNRLSCALRMRSVRIVLLGSRREKYWRCPKGRSASRIERTLKSEPAGRA